MDRHPRPAGSALVVLLGDSKRNHAGLPFFGADSCAVWPDVHRCGSGAGDSGQARELRPPATHAFVPSALRGLLRSARRTPRRVRAANQSLALARPLRSAGGLHVARAAGFIPRQPPRGVAWQGFREHLDLGFSVDPRPHSERRRLRHRSRLHAASRRGRARFSGRRRAQRACRQRQGQWSRIAIPPVGGPLERPGAG